jgi:coenzyme PQQ biosynthesis protein PqqD
MSAAAEPTTPGATVPGPERRPRLARGSRLRWDEARQSWVVLAPERVILLDEIAHEIVRRCDGASTIAEITADLARSFEAEPGEVAADVETLIEDLLAKRIMAT